MKFAGLFEEFSALLELVSNCSRSDAEEVARKAQEWGKLFKEMKFSITPYVHIIVTHLPMSVKLFGNVNKLSGKLVEAANDSVKRTHLQRTSHKFPKQTLQAELRLQLQETIAREEEAKSSRKRKAPTPNPEISKRQKAAERQRREKEAEERAAATAAQTSPYAELSSKELRDLIFSKTGKKTRKQNHEALMDALTTIELYQNPSRG